MGSIDVFVENINRFASYHKLETYKQIAEHLHVTEDSLKHWQNKTRSPSLRKVDEISDQIGCKTYALLKKDGEIFAELEFVQNNSREILIKNLKRYFGEAGKFTWNDRTAMFYGFVSEDVLKSYFREKNYKTPPLKKLDEMAEALGKPTYELIKEDITDEKTD